MSGIKINGKALAKSILALIMFCSFWFSDFDLEVNFNNLFFMILILILPAWWFIISMGDVFQND